MFGIVRAPRLGRAGLSWFNVERPLDLPDLAGRLVILDFWTFCCINCVHAQPTLRRIEEAFPTQVAVIGVHSPKYAYERDPAAVAQAIRRYGIRHPVVHDPKLELWREYRIRAWPTLVFVAPDGYVIGQLPGEPDPELIVQGIGDMVAQFWRRGELSPAALPLVPPAEAGGRLRFPGKIKPCPAPDGGRWWAVADAGHHQVLLVADDGTELARYGSGCAGFADGDEPAFNGPEGLACDARSIWVADTRNHAIRRIDRASGRVATVAGTGCRGEALRHPQPAAGASLASPWDLERADGVVYFANAGSHQIGTLDLEHATVRPLAGTGAEDIRDGAADAAHLAQPSGLALSPAGDRLYFADSETSAVRRVDLGPAPAVATLAGSGLFEYGYANGPLGQARLQHPLGLAATAGRLYVADSYNCCIRVVDLAGGTIADLEPLSPASPDCPDAACQPAGEPAGVAADGPDRLLVSDTNNHRILEIRLDRGTCRVWLA